MDLSEPMQPQDQFQTVVNATWTLVFSATTTYKHCYEIKSGSSSSSRSHGNSDLRHWEGLSEAGMCLQRALRKRFKIVEGEKFFENPKNEWVHTTQDPIGPYKTYTFRREVVRDWVSRCPNLE